MPVAFRSNAWLPDRANKLKPNVLSASSASGGERKPLPSWTVSPFSATAPSKLVNATSPFSSPRITGTEAGAVSRRSDRIIDCPVKVIVIAVEFGAWAAAIMHTITDGAPRRAATAKRLRVFNLVPTWTGGTVTILVRMLERSMLECTKGGRAIPKELLRLVRVLAGGDENHACNCHKQRESEHSDVEHRSLLWPISIRQRRGKS